MRVFRVWAKRWDFQTRKWLKRGSIFFVIFLFAICTVLLVLFLFCRVKKFLSSSFFIRISVGIGSGMVIPIPEKIFECRGARRRRCKNSIIYSRCKKQMLRQWQAKLSSFLHCQNYVLSSVDHSIFLEHHDTNTIVFLVYVNDIVITSNDAKKISQITHLLDQYFKIKNLKDLIYGLGHEVTRNYTSIHLSQHKYTLDLLHDTGMLDCAPHAYTYDSILLAFSQSWSQTF